MLHLCDRVDSIHAVRDVLIDKHPPGQPAYPDSITENDPPEVHPVLFESIDTSMIRSATLRITGAAGPSGLDAACRRRLCTFKYRLCNSYITLIRY